MSRPWQLDAACAGSDPNEWYPPTSHTPASKAQREMCHGCPVKVACLADALATSPYDDHGIRAGLSAAQRRTLRDGKPERQHRGHLERRDYQREYKRLKAGA